MSRMSSTAKNRNIAAHFENARHAMSVSHAVVGVGGYCRHVMSQQDPGCFRRPRQQRRIVHTAQARILHTNYVKRRVAAEQRANNVVVKVLVRPPAQMLRRT